MGTEATFQTIPEDCELLQLARKDREIAEWMQFFDTYATEQQVFSENDDPKEIFFYNEVRKLTAANPGLKDRYFYAGGRTYDAILYLLSPQRRAGEWDKESLIYKAIWGSEYLCEGAIATQGHPIGFVPKAAVPTIADYLDEISVEQLHEYYDPPAMRRAGVYKMFADAGEERFEWIWKEFVGMRNVYRAAATHGEAVITVID